MSQHFRLYADVWNDQPPLHTFLVTALLKWAPGSILLPRLLTVGFSILLLGSLFRIVHLMSGLTAAASAIIIVMGSPGFLELGSSCMLEVPSLSLAVSALACLTFARDRVAAAAAISGLVFGLAMQVKLVPAILLPVALYLIWLRCSEEGERGSAVAFRRALLFFAALSITYIAVDCVLENGEYLRHFRQSWTSHFAPARSLEYGSASDHPFDWRVLLRSWDITVASLIGAAFLTTQARKVVAARIPLLWLGVCFTVFAVHRPWWPYYYIHLALPTSWCCGVGITHFINRVLSGRVQPASTAAISAKPARPKQRRSISTRAGFGILAIWVIAAGGWMGARIYLQVTGIRNSPQIYSELVLGEVSKYRASARFMYTDDLVYSFHSQIPMPPDLAVVPLKRFWAGEMTSARIEAELRQIRPKIVLLKNTSQASGVRDFINSHYRLLYQDAGHNLYVLPDLPGDSRDVAANGFR